MTKPIIGYAYLVMDLPHVGHIHFLNECRKHCDVLITGICTDEEALSRGKRRPIMSYPDRYVMAKHLKMVDLVVMQDDRNYVTILKDLVKQGYDIQRVFHGDDRSPETDDDMMRGKHFVEARGGKFILTPYYQGMSTSQLISTIIKRHTDIDKPIEPEKEG